MATNTADGAWVLGSLREHWVWMLALGILMVVLGAIGLYMTASFTVASVLLFGVLLVIGGIARLLEAFRDHPLDARAAVADQPAAGHRRIRRGRGEHQPRRLAASQ